MHCKKKCQNYFFNFFLSNLSQSNPVLDFKVKELENVHYIFLTLSSMAQVICDLTFLCPYSSKIS
jgi:hypothetical protein